MGDSQPSLDNCSLSSLSGLYVGSLLKTKAVDNDIKARANLAIQKITELRNEIAGYYKDESDKDIQFEFFDS